MDDVISKRTLMVTGLVLGGWLLGSSLSAYFICSRLAARVANSAADLAPQIQLGGANMLASGCVGAAIVVAGTLLFITMAHRREQAQTEAIQESQLALLARMSGVLAHELRNPLTSAKGHSQLLVEMLGNEARAHLKAQYVVKELIRLEGLTDKLLVFARSGQVKPQPVDPSRLVQTAIQRLDGATPVVVTAEEAPSIWSLDVQAMEQVLVNLLRNAVQAQGEQRAPVEVSIFARDKRLFITVRDHGPGAPEGVDLFTPFVTTKITGTGLGLALCRQVVGAHGGRISLTTHPQGGALVEIRIPREQDAAIRPVVASQSAG